SFSMGNRDANMRVTKVCLFVLLVSSFLLNSLCAEGRHIEAKLAKKPKGTIKTLKADNGDIIDCVDMYKQPAFDHPLMKNHALQLEPTLHKYGAKSDNAMLESLFDMSWKKHGGCPEGSVPIVRHFLTDQKIIRKNLSRIADPASNNNGHQCAVIFFQNGQPTMQAARATITIWNPHLKYQNSDFSLSQIWITAGSGSNLQTIEAGWQVYPRRTRSPGPKLFVFWTPDSYASGCYDLTCSGWVLTSNQYSPGMSLQPSTYGGQQSELAMDIERDQRTGNWWLYLWGTPIGYWPPSIYKGGLLATSGSDTLSWGGEIYDSSGSNGFHTLTQMGSGHFPREGYTKASYVRDLFYTDSSRNSYAATQNQLLGLAPAPNCYNYQFQQRSSELYFFYGGPGCN
ncbi:hypothetical protein Ancab_012359, partial [Ancistrocladus abbreviatus]